MPSALVTVLCTSHSPENGIDVLEEVDVLVEASYEYSVEEAKENAIEELGMKPEYMHFDTFRAWDVQGVERGD